MALPTGFDPNKMSFRSVTPVIEIPRNYSTSTSYNSWGSHRESLWSRFNNAVAKLGNWFADHVDNVIGICCGLVLVGIVITGLVYVIGTWINEGFGWALLVAVGALIGGYICLGISWYVVNIVVNIVMYGFRFLFWNGWTLLIALILTLGIILGTSYSGIFMENYTSTTEYVESQTTTYSCTTNTLNIRKYPNTSSNVLGTLQRGDRVEVYEINNGFAKIDFNGSIAYASADYLRPKDQPANPSLYVVNEKFADEQNVENKLQTALNTKLVGTKYNDFQELRDRFNKLGMYSFIEGGMDDYSGYYLYAYSAVRNNYSAKYSRFFLIKYYENNSMKIVDELFFDRNTSDMINLLDLHNNNTGMNKMKFARYRDIKDGVDLISFYEIDTESDKFITKQVAGNWSLNMP